MFIDTMTIISMSINAYVFLPRDYIYLFFKNLYFVFVNKSIDILSTFYYTITC